MDPNANALARESDITRGPTPSGDGTALPTLIGRYKAIKLLGRGGMGEVYLAHDPVLDREVAVKLIGIGMDDPDARHRLVEEARAAGRLRHPNIVTIFDAGEHAGNPYIAMEHIGGETLRSLIQRRAPFSPGRKLALIEGACAGLAHAHRANVVHFDVKPDNLMLDSRGVLKVLDFGVARVLKSEVLVTQHVAGTLRYMSPEQLSGGALDRRSDVFSLGCSLFEFIAYEPAYVGSPHELIARITAGPVPHLADVLPWVDSRLDALVSRAMALDPSERFDDLDELADGLRRFREQLDPIDESGPVSRSSMASASPPRATAVLVSRPRRMTAGLVGAAAALALVLGLGAVWMWRGPVALETREVTAPAVTAQPQTSEPAPTQTGTAGVNLAPGTAHPPASSAAPAATRREDKSRLNASATASTLTAAPPGPAEVPLPQPSRIEPAATPVSPAPAAVREAETTTPAPTLPNPATAVDEIDEVLAALRQYREAYAARDASAVQRIYPRGASDVDSIRRTFESITTYEIDVGQPQVDVRNNMAIIRTLVTRKIVPRVGGPQTLKAETEFRLQRDSRGWIITDVRVNP